jgi:uncharacterized membrane protein
MNWKIFFLTFGSIFLAELGDKTQLATISFTADNVKYKWIVFISASLALILTSFLGVFFGHLLTKFVSQKIIRICAGILFIIIGIVLLYNSSNPIKKEYTKKLNKKIQEISKTEKCIKCIKFKNFLEKNKHIKNKFNIDFNNKDLHSELYCENCNTEELNKILKNKT